MKIGSDCKGECCVCECGGGCIAGHGDDYFIPATKEQIIDNLNEGKYPHYYDYMTSYLKIVFGFEYKEPKHKNYLCEQYDSIYPIETNAKSIITEFKGICAGSAYCSECVHGIPRMDFSLGFQYYCDLKSPCENFERKNTVKKGE